MLSLSKLVELKIDESPFLRENLSEGLINASALARKLKPSIEKELNKTVKDSAIVMAIARLSISKYESVERKLLNFINNIGDLIVRSNLTKYNFKNYNGISRNQSAFLEKSEDLQDSFYTVSRGINETTIIINQQLCSILENNLNQNQLISKTSGLSAITMKLPDNNTELEGIYYYILKKLAWSGISMEEIVSTTNEFTIIVKSTLVSKAFDVLINLKQL